MRFQIVMVYPELFIYVEAFREIIEMLQANFAAMGLQVPVIRNQISTDEDVTPILFGAHLLSPGEDARLPKHTIIYNAEHLVPKNARVPEHYYQTLSRFEVWDFSLENIALIKGKLGNERAHYMPISYCPAFTRVLPGIEDIDVLFYGVINDRRKLVIDRLHAAGLRVLALSGVFGVERDIEIGRAKIVLNMHFDDDAYFESARVAFLLSNRKAVVCESPSGGMPEKLREGIRVVPYERLVEACLELSKNDDERDRLASAGFHAITHESLSSLRFLAERFPQTSGSPTAVARGDLPRVLIAGAGKRTGADFVNADINPRRPADWRVDFGNPLAFGEEADFGRHGRAPLRQGMFDSILAHHVLEHIPDLVTAMTNFLMLLRDGGCLHIEVPYDLSHGAWQDPTHVRAFNERSWAYFTAGHEYLDWDVARFDLLSLSFMLTPLGRKMRAQCQDDEAILRTPRAVDNMRVSLVKRRIDSEEKGASAP